MWRARLACRVAIALLLAACDAPDEAKPPAAAEPAADTVFDEKVGTMDDARKLEDTAAQRKQQLDQSLEQAEAGRQ
jgi:hypothetical protein